MVGTKKSERILLRAGLSRRPLRLTSHRGFSLVELSIVLIIIGLIVGASVTIWRSSIDSTRLSATKTNLDNVKNSVINFAIANGRLPCPDSVVPPNNIGVEDRNPVSGICQNCPNPPCWVPFQTLQIQLPGGKDAFGNVFRYDVSNEPVAGAGLTNTNSDTFCPLLLQYMANMNDVGAQTKLPCVTSTADGADNGQIGALGQGYAVAAVAICQTPVDNVFNAPPGLTGKNIAGTPREYEMANRPNDNNYGNLVAELTYGELYSKVCGNRPRISIQNNTLANRYTRLQSSSVTCVLVNNGSSFDLYLNNTVQFYSDLLCTVPCGVNITYVNASTIDTAGNKNGLVQITGLCAIGDI
jgi:prepilin-type N-terminal cleavage/methylation domain-containing protein